MPAPIEMIVGESTPMRKLAEEIRHLALPDSAVLILGEAGVGRDVAKEIPCWRLKRRSVYSGQPRRYSP